MATTFVLDTAETVTPKDKGGPRVGIGARVMVKRASAGAVGLTIWRGDGGDPETFTYAVRTKWYTVEAGELTELTIGCLDLPAFLPDFTPRTYRLDVSGDGEDITVPEAFIATEPYAAAGSHLSPA